MLARVAKEQRGSPLQVAIDVYLKERLDALNNELAGAESDVDMRRAQGKVHEVKQLIKALSAPI